jgi:DNA-binding PadR family transcriptional regulator
MLTQLLVLWLLAERALSGYRIQRILLDPGVGLWLRIEPASVYSVLRTLARGGAIEAVDAAATRAAEYRITRKGRARLHELALNAWAAPVGDFAATQVAFAVRHELAPHELAAALAQRIDRLRQELAGLDALSRRAFDAQLVLRMQRLLQADLDWLLTL